MLHSLFHLIADGYGLAPTGLPNATSGDPGTKAIQIISTLIISITAAICLLIITISGFRYILSRGDPNAVAQAKNAIIYALVGLFVCILAFTIVTFVVQGIS